EKCVFDPLVYTIIYCATPEVSPTEKYPDDWYKGVISPNDKLWRLDTVSEESEVIFNPRVEAQTEIDMQKLAVKDDGMAIYFINKRDSTLWELTIK
ncbi:MAG: hypothetical protein AAB682_01055, partial [Patescibacteria group bacterium]